MHQHKQSIIIINLAYGAESRLGFSKPHIGGSDSEGWARHGTIKHHYTNRITTIGILGVTYIRQGVEAKRNKENENFVSPVLDWADGKEEGVCSRAGG